jgi:hypothetical protein
MSRLASDPAKCNPDGVMVVERGRILPALSDGVRKIADGRAPNLELYVVPGRSGSVTGFELDGLSVPLVPGVVVPSVAEIDPAFERYVDLGVGGVANNDELLMMTAVAAYALVENDLATGGIDQLRDGRVVLLRKMCLTRVRPPEQSANVHPSGGKRRKDVSDSTSRTDEEFVAIALPIEKVYRIAGFGRGEGVVQRTKVFGPVDEDVDRVPLRPCPTVATSAVDRGRGVAAFSSGQEPVVQPQAATSLR